MKKRTAAAVFLLAACVLAFIPKTQAQAKEPVIVVIDPGHGGDQNRGGEVLPQYVEKNLKGEASYYVTDSEFNYLRQLFRFNGIPHYELVLKDGSISKEELGTHRIRKYLEEHFPVSESAGQGENAQ